MWNPINKKTDRNQSIIDDLLVHEMAPRDVAKKYGITMQRLYQIRKAYGVNEVFYHRRSQDARKP